MSGTQQVMAVYEQLGAAALSNEAFTTALNAAVGVTFISSNLKRAQITLIAAIKSLMKKAPKDSEQYKKLMEAHLIVTSLAQEHKGKTIGGVPVLAWSADARTNFDDKWKKDLSDNVVEWLDYMHAGMKGKYAATPLARNLQEAVWEVVFGTGASTKELLSKANYIGDKSKVGKDIKNDDKVAKWDVAESIEQLLADESQVKGKWHKQMFVLGGHSMWFMDFLKGHGYERKKSTETDYSTKKAKNGEMVHVQLTLTTEIGNKAVKHNLKVKGSVDRVYAPPKRMAWPHSIAKILHRSVEAHQSISNLLLREEEKEYEMARLRAAANRRKRSEREQRWYWN